MNARSMWEAAEMPGVTAWLEARRAEQAQAQQDWRDAQDWSAVHRQTEIDRQAQEAVLTIDPEDLDTLTIHETDPDAFERREGVTSQQVSRTGQWVAQMGPTDRLIDLLAREWFEAKLSLVPADVSIASGDLAMRLTRSLARSAVARARKHAADWEAHADALTAAIPTFADGFAPSWEAWVEAGVKPLPAQVINASMDPMGKHVWSMFLEARGTQLIQQVDGDRGRRPDVWDKDAKRHIARPDPMAHTAEVRYVLPQPCRYGQNGLQPASVIFDRPTFFAASEGLTAGTQPVHERLTTIGAIGESQRYRLCVKANREHVEAHAFAVLMASVLGSKVPKDRLRIGWRGHKLISWETAPQHKAQTVTRAAKKQATKQARKEAGVVGKRGPARTAWSYSARSLSVPSHAVADAVQAIQAILTTQVVGSSVDFTDGTTVTIIGPSQVHDAKRGRAYPLGEWSRRAAIAGLNVA